MSSSPTSVADMSLRGLLLRIDRTDLARTAVVAVCVILLLAGVTWPWQQAPAVAIAGLLVGCWPIFFEALHDARERRMSMEASMLIAVFAAAAIGEWRTALIITLFVLIAEILEDLSLQRGQVALIDLMQFLPQSVQTRTDDSAIISVPLSELSTGSTVIIAPGGHIPVDGRVVVGHSTLDQSRITGESLPVDVGPKSPVFAGSINQVGALEIQAEKVGADSSYGRIIEAVHRAQSSPAPAQQLADRLAAWLIYLALGSALITFIITRDWPTTIAVIVVAGACGVVAGTPLAILATIARAARHGAFIKGGVALEKLSTIDTVIFDKTGTLTVGTFQVIDIITANNVTEQQLLQLAASAESYSEHPLGQAIVRHAQSHTVDIVAPENFNYQPGCSITAGINGQIIKAGNSTYITNTPPDLAIPPHATAVYVSIDDTTRAPLC